VYYHTQYLLLRRQAGRKEDRKEGKTRKKFVGLSKNFQNL
jgi:hypothetical protein